MTNRIPDLLQESALGPESDHVVAFVDVGTNSIRLMLVRIQPNHAYAVISQQREQVRLGEDEFAAGRLQPAAMERAVLVCRSFRDLARSYGAAGIVAVGTSATREAANKVEFLHRLRSEAGLELHVISGLEEARLIYLGIRSRADFGENTALCVDIGGGSTEVIAGDRRAHLHLDSLRLGALRLTNDTFGTGGGGPVTSEQYLALERHIRLKAAHLVQALDGIPIDMAYGTSGTIRNLAAAAARVLHHAPVLREQRLTRTDLRQIARLLRRSSREERARVPGVNPERADIIVAGAAILETLMTDLNISEIVALADCGVREGLLVDYLERSGSEGLVRGLSVRERSVLQLARACNFDEQHARRVQSLALQLFDSGRSAGLHSLRERERELLEFAALLHDIGSFISYRDHHVHSAYLIRNADLLGFDQDEMELMAATTLYHRKSPTGLRDAGLAILDVSDRKAVRTMSLLLWLAERLDRSRTGCVRSAEFREAGKDAVVIALGLAGDCHLELWGIEGGRKAAEKTLGRSLRVTMTQAAELLPD